MYENNLLSWANLHRHEIPNEEIIWKDKKHKKKCSVCQSEKLAGLIT